RCHTELPPYHSGRAPHHGVLADHCAHALSRAVSALLSNLTRGSRALPLSGTGGGLSRLWRSVRAHSFASGVLCCLEKREAATNSARPVVRRPAVSAGPASDLSAVWGLFSRRGSQLDRWRLPRVLCWSPAGVLVAGSGPAAGELIVH